MWMVGAFYTRKNDPSQLKNLKIQESKVLRHLFENYDDVEQWATRCYQRDVVAKRAILNEAPTDEQKRISKGVPCTLSSSQERASIDISDDLGPKSASSVGYGLPLHMKRNDIVAYCWCTECHQWVHLENFSSICSIGRGKLWGHHAYHSEDQARIAHDKTVMGHLFPCNFRWIVGDPSVKGRVTGPIMISRSAEISFPCWKTKTNRGGPVWESNSTKIV